MWAFQQIGLPRWVDVELFRSSYIVSRFANRRLPHDDKTELAGPGFPLLLASG